MQKRIGDFSIDAPPWGAVTLAHHCNDSVREVMRFPSDALPDLQYALVCALRAVTEAAEPYYCRDARALDPL